MTNIFGLDRLVDYILQNPSVIIWALLIYTFIFALSVFLKNGKPGKNPFATDFRRPREKLVTDQKIRDALLKQRFKPAKVPEKLDAVIIGSGAGGLSTAVLLARTGKKVLVLEQHDQAGGCCHTYHEKGFEFDTGIHYVGKMDGSSMLYAAVDQLTEGQLLWEHMDDAFDIVAMGTPGKAKLYPMKTGAEEYYANLISMFPEEAVAINKYRQLIKRVRKSTAGPILVKMFPPWFVKTMSATGLLGLFFGDFFRFANRTLKSVLDELTNNKELKAVLSYILGDYGLMPHEAPFSLHAMLVEHYRNGGYYPQGGTSEIPFQMIRSIERYDGKVLVQAPVSQILFGDSGRAIGVRVTTKSGETDIRAKCVISSAGAGVTFKKLMPKEIAMQSPYYAMHNRIGQGATTVTVFCGLSGTAEELGIPASNYWAYTSSDIDGSMSEYLSMSVEDVVNAECPVIYASFPGAKDSSWEARHPGKSVALLITIAKWEWFSQWEEGRDRHRGDDYNDLKTVMGRNIWKQILPLFPKFDGNLEYMEVGTPVTNQFYLGNPTGSIYGMDQRAERFTTDTQMKSRPETGIPGLYLTGQDIYMAGFVSAVLAGMLCAGSILNRNMIRDLESFRKKTYLAEKKKDD